MKTTNKYPEFRFLSEHEIETEEGRFKMSVFKEKCGHGFKVEHRQLSFIMNGVEYEFNLKGDTEFFKMIGDDFVYDPMNVIESNFVQEVSPRVVHEEFLSLVIHYKTNLAMSVAGLLEETRGNEYGIR